MISRIRIDCSTRFSIRNLLVAIALLTIAPNVSAQQLLNWRTMEWSESFSPAPTVQYALGSATRIDTVLGYAVLTPEEESRSGRLFLTHFLPVEYFDATFRAWFGRSTSQNNSGADGIVFIMAPLFDYPESGGGTLNFDGCLGYGVEFDTYLNIDKRDRSNEHVAIIKDNAENHLISEMLANQTLEDERWHVLRVRFRAGYVEVYIDGTRRLNGSITDFYPFEGFFGFSSATGFASNEHRIDDITLSLPTRASIDFPPINLCGPVEMDTMVSIVNNHPDGTPLLVTSVTLETAPPSVFSIAANPAPASIAQGSRLNIPLRINVTAGGDYSAVLKVETAQGEIVYDTLRIIADEPRLELIPKQIDFPVTWTGDTSTVTASLRNTGRVPVTVTGARWKYSGLGVFDLQIPVPVTLLPGDSIPAVFTFFPSDISSADDSLYIQTECNEIAVAGVHGKGENEYLFCSLRTPMVLSPGETGALIIAIDSIPRSIAIETVFFELTLDTAFAGFRGIETITPGLTPDAVIGTPALQSGTLFFSLTEPEGLRDTGAVLGVRLQAVAEGPECRDLRLEWYTLQPYALRGSNDGDVCINPSCRLPDGLHRSQLPIMTVSPQPAREALTVQLEVDGPVFASVRLHDARGRTLRTLYEGQLAHGTHMLRQAIATFPSGPYFVSLSCAFGGSVTPLVIQK